MTYKIELYINIYMSFTLSKLPHIEILRIAGSGSFGINGFNVGYVFEAYDHNRKQKVALKRIEKVGNLLSREYEILFEVRECDHVVKILVIMVDILRTFSTHELIPGN